MNVLLIEDDLAKGQRLTEHLKQVLVAANVEWVKSVTSAIRIMDSLPFSLVVLDMSLPTFEEGVSIFSGGRQQNFGGSEVLAYMKALNIVLPTIVVTQFPDFEENGQLMTLAQLNTNLVRDFPQSYRGLVQYKNNDESWKALLSDLIYTELSS